MVHEAIKSWVYPNEGQFPEYILILNLAWDSF